MENKDKLLSLKEGLEIIKKYDENGNLDYIKNLLDSDVDSFDSTLPPELFNELVHSNVASYTNEEFDKKTKK